MHVPVGIAIGSNLGDRQAELDAAIAFLRFWSYSEQLQASTRIETAPVDCPPGSPPFLNAVVEIRLDPEIMPPRKLLAHLQEFERSRGRATPRSVNAPRSLDLDILYYGEQVINESDLVVPHPRAAQRRFVLEPLSQLRPNLILPGQVETVSALLRRCHA